MDGAEMLRCKGERPWDFKKKNFKGTRMRQETPVGMRYDARYICDVMNLKRLCI